VNFVPFFQVVGYKIAAQNAERALDGRQTFRFFVLIIYVILYMFETNQACFGRV
jgi:hypothetical protein